MGQSRPLVNTLCQSQQEAVEVIEGLDGLPHSEDEMLDAYQYLIDTHQVWQMPKYYGRAAADLIQAGQCHR